MEEYHHHHHHHNVTASPTQEPSVRLATLHSLHPSSSSNMSNSRTGHPPSSTGDVPMTTSGPITISVVIALTLVICMILNCGKVKRKINPYRNTQPLIDGEKIIEKGKKPTPASTLNVSPMPPPSTHGPATTFTTTFFYPTRPPPVVHQPRYARFYPPQCPHPIPPHQIIT